MGPKLSFLLILGMAAATGASLPAWAAPPPVPVPIIPDTAQERLQAQLAVQQAQAQARIAADQARVQAQLDANQARLEGQVAAGQAKTQGQLEVERQNATAAAQLAALSLPAGAPLQETMAAPARTMQLAMLTPELGHYFGTDRGVLVVHAPANGLLKLRDGDVILSIGGRTPASTSQAVRILTSYDPGEKIRLEILREHHKLAITATMPALPAGP